MYKKTDGITQYDFSNFTLPFKFTFNIHRRDLTLQKTKYDQQKLEILINKLNKNYNPRKQAKIKEKTNVIKSAKRLLSMREEIINAFKKCIF